MRLKTLTLKLLALVLLVVPKLALAVPVTYVFTGNIGTAAQGCWMRSGPDVCGSDLFGYFTIDDQPVFFDDTFATYSGSGGPYGMYLSVGGQSGWNSTVGLDLYHESPRIVFSDRDVVFLHTGISPAEGGGDPNATLRFTSYWHGHDAFDGPPRFPPMPDPSDWFNGSFNNVCAESDGCKITVGESILSATMTIYDWTFFRSPVVIPMPVAEPGTLALFGLGIAGLAVMRRRRVV